jgi:hypothetical protein
MSTHAQSPESSQHADPLLPGVTGLHDETTRATASTKKLVELSEHLDAFAGTLATSPGTLPVLDLPQDLKFSDLVVGISLGWPDGLFIPGTADYKQYWFLPPAAGTHRYTRGWNVGNGSAANHATPATGDLFAYAAARPTDPKLRSEAGIGFVFKPAAKLAVYEIEVTANLAGQNRYDVSTTAPAGGTLREWGGLYTSAWEMSPIDGSLTLVQPYGLVTLFNQTFQNLTGTPIQTWPLTKRVTANIMLEGGRSYLVGIIAAVEIDNQWTSNNGGPMQPLPDGSTWKAWCSITGNIPQVWVTPKTVYIP